MVKILLLLVLGWVVYCLGKRYRHALGPRFEAFAHGAAALLTLGATLPASILSRSWVSTTWRESLGWVTALGALAYAFYLACYGDGGSAAPGSLQASKYLLPALLGLGMLGVRLGAQGLTRPQLPQAWQQQRACRSLFLFFSATGIWLMAAVLHRYLNAGFSEPGLAPWVNNVYWLIALGLLSRALLGEVRQMWLLQRLQRLRLQRRAAFSLNQLVQAALRRFPGSRRGALWALTSTWTAHQQTANAIECVSLGGEQWVFDQTHYVESLLAFLELPCYRRQQRPACQQWLAQTFQLPKEAASALLARIESKTA